MLMEVPSTGSVQTITINHILLYWYYIIILLFTM